MRSIRKNFSEHDFQRVQELVVQMDPTATVTKKSLRRACENGYVSAIWGGSVLIGMGWIFPRQTLLRKQAVIEDMVVDEAYRRKGYGEQILLDLIAWAKNHGIEVIELTTNPARVAANELYKKHGFVIHETNHYLLDFRLP